MRSAIERDNDYFAHDSFETMRPKLGAASADGEAVGFVPAAAVVGELGEARPIIQRVRRALYHLDRREITEALRELEACGPAVKEYFANHYVEVANEAAEAREA